MDIKTIEIIKADFNKMMVDLHLMIIKKNIKRISIKILKKILIKIIAKILIIIINLKIKVLSPDLAKPM